MVGKTTIGSTWTRRVDTAKAGKRRSVVDGSAIDPKRWFCVSILDLCMQISFERGVRSGIG